MEEREGGKVEERERWKRRGREGGIKGEMEKDKGRKWKRWRDGKRKEKYEEKKERKRMK